MGLKLAAGIHHCRADAWSTGEVGLTLPPAGESIAQLHVRATTCCAPLRASLNRVGKGHFV
jgi:hypothetical protein